MASVISEVAIDTAPDDAWAALRDFHAVHERLAPGFVVDSQPVADDTRIVTFFNGAVAREVLVGIDDEARRLCYTVVDGPLQSTHHNASAQVFAEPEGRSRFVWITDVLPHDRAEPVGLLMERGLDVLKGTLEAANGRQPAESASSE